MFHLIKIKALWPPHLRGCPSTSGQCSRWPQLPNYHHYFEMLGAVTRRRTFTPCQHTDTSTSYSPITFKLQTFTVWWKRERKDTNAILKPHVIAVPAKVHPCSGARGGGWCHYALAGCELVSPVTRSPLTGGQWVPGKLNKHRPPSYFWSADSAVNGVFTGYLPWLRGTVNVLRSHGIKPVNMWK